MQRVADDSADDREAFALEQREAARAVGADSALRRDARAVLAHADRNGWTYAWRWLGVPVIQSPEDVLTMQEIIWETRPDLVIETGVARGGSVLLYASLLELLGIGTVVGVDIDIRAHNRRSIEEHPLGPRISLIEGSSTSGATVDRVRALANRHERVMVVLDSDHTHKHVLAELRAYASMVTVGQFLVVADTIVEELPAQVHRPRPWGPGNNPATALAEFLREESAFERDELFNGRLLLTSSPGGYLRRVR